MANNVKKLPFPEFLLRTPCEIKLHTGNVNEDGDKEIYKIDKDLKCIYSDKVIVKGDIAPKLKSVSDGVIVINDNELLIHKGARPRNPDGTVHHTEFEVI